MKTEPGRLQASTLPRTGVLSLKRFLRGLALRGTNPKSGSMRKGRVNAELETRGSGDQRVSRPCENTVQWKWELGDLTKLSLSFNGRGLYSLTYTVGWLAPATPHL